MSDDAAWGFHMMPEPQDDDDFDDDLGGSCQTCSGDCWTECRDPLTCTREHAGDMHRCPNCGGSGSAKDQTYW